MPRRDFRAIGFLACLALMSLGITDDGLTASPKDKPKHVNRLAKETSPYLLMHAHNPTNWYAWGPEAFEKARKENKIVFLSIGYSSCYWCHVMERESFNNEEVAKILNGSFVCIKVDREERPEIDHIYMTAVNQLGQSGGWPLSMFLLPDGRPIVGGTYWPPEDRKVDDKTYPGFKTILKVVRDAHRDNAKSFEKQADDLAERTARALESTGIPGIAIVPLDSKLIEKAVEDLQEEFDPEFGGFGSPNRKFRGSKFPMPARLEFLLQIGANNKNKKLIDMVTLTLDQMALIYTPKSVNNSATVVQVLTGGGSTTTVTSGGALQIQSSGGFVEASSKTLSINGAGFNNNGAVENVLGNNTWVTPVILGSDSFIGADGSPATSSLVFTQAISDAGLGYAVTKVGTGAVQYTGNTNNTYTGLTTVEAGTLLLSKTGLATAVAGNLTIGDGATAGLLQQTQTLNFAGFTSGQSYKLSFNGEPTGNITWLGGVAGDAAAIKFALNSLPFVASLSSPLMVAQVGTTPVFKVIFGGAMLGTTWPQILGYPVSPATGTIGVTSATTHIATIPNGILVSLQPSTINQIVPTATVTVNDYSALVLGSNNQQTLAALTLTSGDVSLGSGSTLTLSGNLTAASDATGAAIIQGPGNLALLTTAHTFNVTHGAAPTIASDLVITAPITGTALPNIAAVTKTGAGQLELAGVNTYTGATEVDAGNLQVDNVPTQTITLGGTLVAGTTTFRLTYTNPGAPTAITAPIAYTTSAAATAVLIQYALNNALVGSTIGPAIVNAISSTVFTVAFTGPYGPNAGQLTGTITGAGTIAFAVNNGPQQTITLAGPNLDNSTTFTLTYTNPSVNANPLTTSFINYSTTSGAATAAGIQSALNQVLVGAATGPVTVTPVGAGLNVFNVTFATTEPGGVQYGLNLPPMTGAVSGTGNTISIANINNLNNVVMKAGALGGNATIGSVAGLTANSAFTVNPGGGPAPATTGLLQTNGDVTWNANTIFFVNLNSSTHPTPIPGADYDQLDVNGNVNLGGAFLTGKALAGIRVNDTFTILSATGTVSQQLAGFATAGALTPTTIAQDGVIFLGGQKFTVHYFTNSVVLTRVAASATIALVANQSTTSVYGQDVTFTATVTPESGFPLPATGSFFTFKVDGGAGTNVPVNVTNGTATFDPQLVLGATLGVGPHTITASFSDGISPAGIVAVAPNLATVNITVGKASTSRPVVTSSANPVYNAPITINAKVTPFLSPEMPAQLPPGGTLTFKIDNVAFAGTVSYSTATNPGSGTYSITIPANSLTPGPHAITATYNGDSNYVPNPTTATFTLNVHVGTSISMPTSSSINDAGVLTSGSNTPVTFKVTVSADNGATLNAGIVNFYDNGVLMPGSASVSGGMASYTTSSLTLAGSPHSITAKYAGAGNFNASPMSAALTQQVFNASTTAFVSTPVITNGQTPPVNFSVTVQGSNGAAPTGTLSIYNGPITVTGGVVSGTLMTPTSVVATPSGPVSGVYTTTYAFSFPSSDFTTVTSLTAVYFGDTVYAPSTNTIPVSVAPAPTTLTLAQPTTPVGFGNPVTLQATVTVTNGAKLPTPIDLNSVHFFDGTTNLGAATSLVSGPGAGTPTYVFSFTTTATQLAAAAHSITAQFAETNFVSQTSSAKTVVVNQADTAVSTPTANVTSAPSGGSEYGQQVTFTATVSVPGAYVGATGAPNGSLVFKDGTTVLGTGTLFSSNAAGRTATYTYQTTATQLAINNTTGHSITAVYNSADSGNFNTGTSAALIYKVDPVSTTTTISTTAASSTFGQGMTYTATVAAANTAGILGSLTGNVIFHANGVTLGPVAGVAIDTTSHMASLPNAVAPAGAVITATFVPTNTNFATSTGTLTGYTINPATTSVMLAPPASPWVPGGTAGASATVTVTSPTTGTVIPKGTILFTLHDNSGIQSDQTYTMGLDSTGHATASAATTGFTFNAFTISNHSYTLTATYTPTSNFTASPLFDSFSQLVVNPTTTAFVLPAPAATYGQTAPIVFTVTVKGSTTNGQAPDGAVSIYNGAVTGTPVGSAATRSSFTVSGSTYTSTYNVSVPFSAISAGTAHLTAVYAGDSNYGPSTSAVLNEPVSPAPTTLALATLVGTTQVTSTSFGNALTLKATVTVTNGAPLPTPLNPAAVTFLNGSAVLGTATSVVAGSAANTYIYSFTTTPTQLAASANPYSFTAKFALTNFASQTSAAHTVTVTQALTAVGQPTSDKTSSTPSGGSYYGQQVTFTVTVFVTGTGTIGSPGAPIGTVTFYDGTAILGTGTLQSSNPSIRTATYTYKTYATQLGINTTTGHSITAVFNTAGTGNFAKSPASGALIQKVDPIQTMTSISTSVPSATYGQSVTYTATVSATIPAGVSAVPAGSVQFKDVATGAILGTVTLNSSFQASLTTAAVSANNGASPVITAKFIPSGSPSLFGGSTGSLTGFTINKLATTLKLVFPYPNFSSWNPGGATGASVMVTSATPGIVPTGTVTFTLKDNSGRQTLQTFTMGLDTTGKATTSASQFSFLAFLTSSRSYTLTATYNANADFAAGPAATHTQLVGRPSSITVTSPSAHALVTQPITFTATITGAFGTPTGGTVTFYDVTDPANPVTLGSGTLSSGKATYTYNPSTQGAMSIGTHKIIAIWSPNAGGVYGGSLSPALNQDFTSGSFF